MARLSGQQRKTIPKRCGHVPFVIIESNYTHKGHNNIGRYYPNSTMDEEHLTLLNKCTNLKKLYIISVNVSDFTDEHFRDNEFRSLKELCLEGVHKHGLVDTSGVKEMSNCEHTYSHCHNEVQRYPAQYQRQLRYGNALNPLFLIIYIIFSRGIRLWNTYKKVANRDDIAIGNVYKLPDACRSEEHSPILLRIQNEWLWINGVQMHSDQELERIRRSSTVSNSGTALHSTGISTGSDYNPIF